MDYRKVKLAKREKLKQLKELQLMTIYREIVSKLNQRYSSEKVITGYESQFAGLIKNYTKLQFYQSTWIGSRCVDIFIPSIAGDQNNGRRMKGLVIEINGPIHDEYKKMNRDENLGDYLSRLGIGVISIENYDLRHPILTSLLESISALNKIDHRARQRVWRNIYIETLIKNEDLIESLGSISSRRALEILRRVK